MAVEQGCARQVLKHWHSQQALRPAPAAAPAGAAPAGAATASDELPAPDRAGGLERFPAGIQLQPSVGAPPGNSGGDACVPVQVAVQQLGCFLFKGCAKSTTVLNIVPQQLVGRRFPSEAPKGKGVRLAHTRGVVEDSEWVWLPSHVAGVRVFGSEPAC